MNPLRAHASTRLDLSRAARVGVAAACMVLLSGCDLLGIESASQVAAKREAEGKAIGAGCRHAARSLEDCFSLNRRADRAAVFAGWKEMNDYMRENKLEPMPPSGAVADASDKAGDEKKSKP